MITKEKIIAELQRLPDKFTLEEFIERLIFLENLRREYLNQSVNKLLMKNLSIKK
jgi:hypothetical protein